MHSYPNEDANLIKDLRGQQIQPFHTYRAKTWEKNTKIWLFIQHLS